MKKDEAQWIEQRKKKYPTQAAVERRKQELQEKIGKALNQNIKFL
jgi:Nuclear fragile X mental retardation-interacting protein 1 (NUFIP1)